MARSTRGSAMGVDLDMPRARACEAAWRRAIRPRRAIRADAARRLLGRVPREQGRRLRPRRSSRSSSPWRCSPASSRPIRRSSSSATPSRRRRSGRRAARGAISSAPTAPAATCSRASSMARAFRCSSASRVMSVSFVIGIIARPHQRDVGPVVDVAITRVMDLIMSVPSLVLAILVVAVLGPEPRPTRSSR